MVDISTGDLIGQVRSWVIREIGMCFFFFFCISCGVLQPVVVEFLEHAQLTSSDLPSGRVCV